MPILQRMGNSMMQQCKGKTKSGAPCKNKGEFSNGYCRLHQDQAPAEPSSKPADDEKKTDAPSAEPSDSKWCCECDPKMCLAFMAVAAVIIILIFLVRSHRKQLKEEAQAAKGRFFFKS